MKKIFVLSVFFALFSQFFVLAGDFGIKSQIPAGTVLVMNRSPFTKERFVFTSESAGIYQAFFVEYCKESEENPYGIMYEKDGEDKAFSYDGKTGHILVKGEETCRALVYIPYAKVWFMYDDSVVFVRAVAKAQKLMSAWGKKRFDKPKFMFFSDGKCRIDDIDGTYTELDGIFCVSTLYSSNFLYFFQKENALYQGIDYLYEQTEEK